VIEATAIERAPAVERSTYRWWVLASVVVTNFLIPGVSWNYVIMVVPQILGDLGLEIGDWGALWAAVSLGVLLFSVPAGALGDRFGVRRVVGFGQALVAASLFLRAAAGGFGSMLLCMVFFGVAMGLVIANIPKVLGLWFPLDELGMANGVSIAGQAAGIGTATFLTPILLGSLDGWRSITRGLAILTVALTVLWLATMRDRAVASYPAGAREAVLKAIGRVLQVRDMWILALCFSLFLGGYLGVIGYIGAYFTTVQGMSPETVGANLSLGAWTSIFGNILLPTLSDKIGLRRIVYVVAIFANGLIVFAIAYLLGVSLTLACIAWGFTAGAIPLLFVVPIEMERVGPALAGSAAGVLNTAGFAGGFLAPLIGMSLVRISPILGFAFWAGCYMVSALLFATIAETGRRRQDLPKRRSGQK
jgi:NNP family nitrate/nitrite transporter-like MFS transporter